MLHVREIIHSTTFPLNAGLDRVSACQSCPVRNTSTCDCLEWGSSLLSEISQRIIRPAKSVLFEDGSHAAWAYNIVRGVVRLSRDLSDGRRQVLGIALPGDLLGATLAEMHGFTATALTEVEFCRMDREQLAELLDENPRLVRRLFATNATELSLARDHIVLLGCRSADEKVASFLLRLRERWASINAASARVDLPMTRQDIGDYLGLTLETVSRTFSKLAKRKLIAIIPDGVRILDMKALEALAVP